MSSKRRGEDDMTGITINPEDLGLIISAVAIILSIVSMYFSYLTVKYRRRM